MNTTSSAGCLTGVTITPSTGTFVAGDVLTCSANGYNPAYTWTGIAGANRVPVSTTGVYYTLLEGTFCVICTATFSQLLCRNYATISDTAYGKCLKQLYCNNIVEKITIFILRFMGRQF